MPSAGLSSIPQLMINTGPTLARAPEVEKHSSGLGSLTTMLMVGELKIVGITTPAVLPVPGGAQHRTDKVSFMRKSLPLNLPTTIQKPSSSPIFLMSLISARRAEP